MAMIRAISASGSGSIVKMPFKLSPSSNRITFNSQDCYVWSDNGTTKIHYEFDVTARTSISGAGIMSGIIPYKVNSNMNETGVLPNGWKIQANSTNTMMVVSGNLTNGATYTLNTDVAVDWNN